MRKRDAGRVALIALLGFALGGCATAPLTQTVTLKNPHSGKTVVCGGKHTAPTFWHGAFGYKIAQRNKAECIKKYEHKGFKQSG